jgi:hypothetical protein
MNPLIISYYDCNAGLLNVCKAGGVDVIHSIDIALSLLFSLTNIKFDSEKSGSYKLATATVFLFSNP